MAIYLFSCVFLKFKLKTDVQRRASLGDWEKCEVVRQCCVLCTLVTALLHS